MGGGIFAFLFALKKLKKEKKSLKLKYKVVAFNVLFPPHRM